MRRRAFTIIALCAITLFGFSITTPSLSLASPPTVRSLGLVDYTQTKTEPQPNGGLHVDGNYIKNEAGQIVKLRGTVFAPDVCYWAGHGTKQQVKYVYKWGFNHIRLCISIGGWNDDSSGWENYAQNIVDWASERGVYVVIMAMWWDYGGAVDTRGWTWQFDTVRNFWDTFANKFKNNDYVLYDLLNEPYFSSTSVAHGFCQDLVNIVRQYSDQICIVEAYSLSDWYNPGLNSFVANPLTGGNVAYSSHHFWWPQVNTPNPATKGRLDYVGVTALIEDGHAWWMGEINYDASSEPYGGDWMRDMLKLIEDGPYAGWCHWGWMTDEYTSWYYELADWNGNPSHQGIMLQEYL